MLNDMRRGVGERRLTGLNLFPSSGSWLARGAPELGSPVRPPSVGVSLSLLLRPSVTDVCLPTPSSFPYRSPPLTPACILYTSGGLRSHLSNPGPSAAGSDEPRFVSFFDNSVTRVSGLFRLSTGLLWLDDRARNCGLDKHTCSTRHALRGQLSRKGGRSSRRRA